MSSVRLGTSPAVAELVVKDRVAEVDAFVADRAGGSGDDLQDVSGWFAAERAARERAAQFAVPVVVLELMGDLPRGFGELVISAGARAQVGLGVVKRGGELVKGAVEQLPGDHGEPGAFPAQLPRGTPFGVDALRDGAEPGFVSGAQGIGLGIGSVGKSGEAGREPPAGVHRRLEAMGGVGVGLPGDSLAVLALGFCVGVLGLTARGEDGQGGAGAGEQGGEQESEAEGERHSAGAVSGRESAPARVALVSGAGERVRGCRAPMRGATRRSPLSATSVSRQVGGTR